MFKKMLDVPVSILKILLGINFLGALILIFINVILRTANLATLEWAEPLVIYLIMWAVFLGAGLIFSDDEHLSMGILYDYLPQVGKKILDVFNCILTIAVSFFLIYFGAIVTRNLYVLGQTSMDGNIPLFLIMVSIPLGGLVTIYCLILTWLIKRPSGQRDGGGAL